MSSQRAAPEFWPLAQLCSKKSFALDRLGGVAVGSEGRIYHENMARLEPRIGC